MKYVIYMCMFAQVSFAQDTLKVEPIEFGFPETPRIGFGPKDKYGSDRSQWPAWMQKGFDHSKGMILEAIDKESLRLNDTLKLILDTARSYTIEKADTTIARHLNDMYYQDNLIYVQADTAIEFLSLKRAY